jgi:hypothetical protein
MELKFREQNIFNTASPDTVDDSPIVQIGTIAKAIDIDPDSLYGESELIYLKAGAIEAVGSVVTFNGSYVTDLAVANAIGKVAVSISVKAVDEYGWYVIRGNVPAEVLASFAAGAKCFLTSTAGSVDDAPVVGDDIFAAKSLTAIDTPSTGLAVINVDHSFTMDGLAS